MATSVVSSAELHTRLADPDLTIVDVRPLPAYNGWRLQGESRGGHIPGAVSFPATWLERVDEVEVERLLREKSIVSGREVVVSGGPQNVAAFRSRLADLGHGEVRVHEGDGPSGPTTPRFPSSVYRTTTGSSTPNGSRSSLREAGRRQHRRGLSCSSTSTSGFPRSTRRTTSRARSTSTRTSSRTRSTGTAARPRSSRRRCAVSGSRMTRRSSSTGAIPKDTRTKSGRAGEQDRSRPAARR